MLLIASLERSGPPLADCAHIRTDELNIVLLKNGPARASAVFKAVCPPSVGKCVRLFPRNHQFDILWSNGLDIN